MAGKKLRGRPKKVESQPAKKSNHEINGIIIIAVSFLFAIGIYSNGAGLSDISTASNSAILLQMVKDFLGGLFGVVIYAIPPIGFIYGALVMFQKSEFTMGWKIILLCTLFVMIAAFVHTTTYDFPQILRDYNKLSKEFYDEGSLAKGGGLFGGLISIWLVKLLGVYGSSVILLAGILILIQQLTQVSFVRIMIEMKKCVVWMAKASHESFKYLKEKSKEQSPKKENITLKGKVTKVKSNIDEEIQKIKDILPDKIFPVEEIDYEQQVIKEAPIKKETEVEKVDIDIHAGSHNDDYKMPHMNLLNKMTGFDKPKGNKKEILETAKKLEETLASFGVEAKVVEINKGPAVTRYELSPSVGVKVSKIVNLADDIALNLAASGIRIEAPIPGKAAVGIEVPNKEVNNVLLREMLEDDKFKHFPSKVSFALGKDVGGEPIIADIAKMPHLLIAGATGSGKSVCINTLITSILYKAKPDEVKLLMIDPKVVELGVYNGIPHLLIPVVTEPKKAAGALNWAVQEMVQRYKTFAQYGVRDIKGYNVLVKDTENEMPQIVIIIDELADLMMVAPNDVEDAICRLAQMARAAGMHLVIATQRPSVDVITGVIKANVPSRISFAVSSQVDSRTILDMAGAEKLLGKGDMLFYPVGEPKPIRVQGTYVSDKEVENVVEYIKSQQEANYSEDIIEKINVDKDTTIDPGENDELLPQAIEIVIDCGQASVSMLQRRLKLGYARAARIIDQMEARGIVGGFEGSKPRQVLITKEEFYSEGFQI